METVTVDKDKLEKVLALYSERYSAFNIRTCNFCPLDGIECTPEKAVDAKCGDAILENICICKESKSLEDYYKDRPLEPCSDDETPVAWAAIAHYAEENLEKAFEQITELEKKVGMYQTGMFDEIEKRDKQLNKAKEIIENLLLMAKVEHLKERYESVEEAEQFLMEVGE